MRSRVRALFARTRELHPEPTTDSEPRSDDSIDEPGLRPPRDWLRIGVAVAFVIITIVL